MDVPQKTIISFGGLKKDCNNALCQGLNPYNLIMQQQWKLPEKLSRKMQAFFINEFYCENVTN